MIKLIIMDTVTDEILVRDLMSGDKIATITGVSDIDFVNLSTSKSYYFDVATVDSSYFSVSLEIKDSDTIIIQSQQGDLSLGGKEFRNILEKHEYKITSSTICLDDINTFIEEDILEGDED